MAEEPKKLNLRFSSEARSSIREIRRWNAERYGPGDANGYLSFLLDHIDRLQSDYLHGTQFGAYRYLVIQRRAGAYGHVVVYRVSTDVEIIEVFHTSQNWLEHLRRLEQE